MSYRIHTERAQDLIYYLRDAKNDILNARTQLHHPRRTDREVARAQTLITNARKLLDYVSADGNYRSVKAEAEVVRGNLETTERMLAQVETNRDR